MAEKIEYQLAYYQQRVGEITMQYEAALSDLRAEAGIQLEALNAEVQRLKEKYEPVSEEENSSGDSTTDTAKGNAKA